MPANADIRALQPSDFSAVQALIKDIHAEQGLLPEFYWPADMVDEEWERARVFGFFGAEGLRAVILYREIPHVWEISLLATAPSAKRQGVMQLLLQHFLDARGRDRDVWLEVHEKNLAAQKLYEKLGFRRTGRRGQYYQDRGTAYLYSYP